MKFMPGPFGLLVNRYERWWLRATNNFRYDQRIAKGMCACSLSLSLSFASKWSANRRTENCYFVCVCERAIEVSQFCSTRKQRWATWPTDSKSANKVVFEIVFCLQANWWNRSSSSLSKVAMRAQACSYSPSHLVAANTQHAYNNSFVASMNIIKSTHELWPDD